MAADERPPPANGAGLSEAQYEAVLTSAATAANEPLGRSLPREVAEAAYALSATRTSAATGWEETAEVVFQARRLVMEPGGLVNRGVDRGLVVVERADGSDPHAKLCDAFTALDHRLAGEQAIGGVGLTGPLWAQLRHVAEIEDEEGLRLVIARAHPAPAPSAPGAGGGLTGEDVSNAFAEAWIDAATTHPENREDLEAGSHEAWMRSDARKRCAAARRAEPAAPAPGGGGEASTTWRATCGVCGAAWKVDETSESPAPHGSFCPDCQDSKRMAPGVLNWTPDALAKPGQGGEVALREALEWFVGQQDSIQSRFELDGPKDMVISMRAAFAAARAALSADAGK